MLMFVKIHLLQNRSALSAIIATLLLILLSVVAVTILWAVLNPMIKGNLEKGKSCFELRDYFQLIESDYSYSNPANTSLMIERATGDYEIKGFVVALVSAGSSKSYKITGGSLSGVFMMNKSGLTNNLEVPKIGEARTYIFNYGNVTEIRLATILNSGENCDAMSFNVEIK